MKKNKKIIVDKSKVLHIQEPEKNNSKKIDLKTEKIKEEKIEVKKKETKSIDDLVKTKKKIESFHSYRGGFGTAARISYSEPSPYSDARLDYESLYSYLGSGARQNFKINYETKRSDADNLGEKDILSSEQVDTILKKMVISEMIKSSMDNISIEEKEKFNYYKQFNRLWVMIKYDLLGLGYHA